MQLGRYLKAAAKKFKKMKEKKKTIDAHTWSCPGPVLEAPPTEAQPISIAARRPYLTIPPQNTPNFSCPVSVATTPEYRLQTYRNVYLRLQDIGHHCGYDMVVDMLNILKKRQDAGYDLRFSIVDYDYDLPLSSRSGPLGRRVSLRAARN